MKVNKFSWQERSREGYEKTYYEKNKEKGMAYNK